MNAHEYDKWKAEVSDQYARDMGIVDEDGNIVARQTDREILVEIRDLLRSLVETDE